MPKAPPLLGGEAAKELAKWRSEGNCCEIEVAVGIMYGGAVSHMCANVCQQVWPSVARQRQ